MNQKYQNNQLEGRYMKEIIETSFNIKKKSVNERISQFWDKKIVWNTLKLNLSCKKVFLFTKFWIITDWKNNLINIFYRNFRVIYSKNLIKMIVHCEMSSINYLVYVFKCLISLINDKLI